MEREYSPTFLIQMSSGKPGEHCDIYPEKSIHEVKRCNQGHLWNARGVDAIPGKFKFIVLDEKPLTKICPTCEREYPADLEFKALQEKEVCNRCVERHTKFNRNN